MNTHSLNVTSLDHINFYVKNLDESVAFYQTLFGFEVKKEQPEENSRIIGNDAVKLCLYEDSEKAHPGGTGHFGFHVQNFSDIVERCESMGVPMPYGVVDWEKSRSVYIVDPSGYEIELSEIQGGGL
ncbi:MAG: VOC family protein [Leptolyngbya foveolarum]|uniref:VOC family protein n=1 Tax=Leptolyngbya foveolarum TaxID=47253 RepID=A0A2W4UTR2_9CYAN|nr:MAG: VOC family protein [Leptolyngbya foveolarum]